MCWFGFAERTRFLRPHQEIQSRPDVVVNGESSPGLLWREDRQRGGLSAVVEGPAGIQSKTRAYNIDFRRLREPVQDIKAWA
jgi:hypothetical protein